jgi:hypothetical protein
MHLPLPTQSMVVSFAAAGKADRAARGIAVSQKRSFLRLITLPGEVSVLPAGGSCLCDQR